VVLSATSICHGELKFSGLMSPDLIRLLLGRVVLTVRDTACVNQSPSGRADFWSVETVDAVGSFGSFAVALVVGWLAWLEKRRADMAEGRLREVEAARTRALSARLAAEAYPIMRQLLRWTSAGEARVAEDRDSALVWLGTILGARVGTLEAFHRMLAEATEALPPQAENIRKAYAHAVDLFLYAEAAHHEITFWPGNLPLDGEARRVLSAVFNEAGETATFLAPLELH
jgi:hypothetical protein